MPLIQAHFVESFIEACPKWMGFFGWYDYCNWKGMTIQEMRDWFDVLQDQTNTDDFTDAEKDEFLEDAMWGFILDYIGDVKEPVRLGMNKSAEAAVQTLIEPVVITTGSDGKVTDVLVNAQLPTGDIILPLSITPAVGEGANFNNHNDISKSEANTYKIGTSTEPNYTLQNGFAQLYPKEVYTALKVVALTKPVAVTDLPEHIHRKQVAKALYKTGLVTEDQALTLMDANQ